MLTMAARRSVADADANEAIAYIRVSTEEQARHGVSLEAQRERLEAYCLMAGLHLRAVISEEGVSASVPLQRRPQGAVLLRELECGVRHVVALKLDRLFRDAEDALHQTKAWDRTGISLHLVDMGGASMNTGSAIGRMMLTMMAGFAEFERNIIAERTSSAVQYKKSHRKVYNHCPYGFKREGENLVAVAEEQEVISRIQHCRASGWTLQRIADALNEGATPTKLGGRWFARTIKNVLENSLNEAAA